MKQVSFAEFLRRARNAHGDKYEYVESSYINMSSALAIVCPKHGTFMQRADHHASKHGCRRCTENGLKDTEWFLRQARTVHGAKYDYTLTTYVGALDNLTIACPVHGPFVVAAHNHLRGSGCRGCYLDGRRLPYNSFLMEAREVHGDVYEYRPDTYTTRRSKMVIVCPKHGEFRQSPRKHLEGKGCKRCRVDSRRVSLDEFKRRACEIHGSLYDYGDTVLGSSITENVVIGCHKHGKFSQAAINHLRGFGCTACGNETRRLSFDEFVQRSRECHGDRYIYRRGMYTKRTASVGIECRIHGVFWQTAHNHLVGRGCPKCSQSAGEKVIMEALVEAGVEFEQEAKLFGRYFYDFHLPVHRVLIEFDGEQHFYPVGFGGTEARYAENKFVQTVNNDRKKNVYAVEHGYVLYRIPYYVSIDGACRAIIREISAGTSHASLSNGGIKMFVPMPIDNMTMYETVLSSDLLMKEDAV